MSNNKGKVAVVGQGPSGSFAARAAWDYGFDVTVYGIDSPTSTPPGAFWLHWLPEDLTQMFTPSNITIIGKGDAEKYAKLQWGDHWYKGLTNSFPTQPVREQGYDPFEVLPALLPDDIKLEIVPYALSDVDIEDLTRAYDFVFQTFPRQKDIQVQPERIPFVAAASLSSRSEVNNVVVYNGLGEGIVVREAILFGNHFLEFPKGLTVQDVKKRYDISGYSYVTLKDLAPNTKPVPHPGNKLYLMGRYAQWDRRCLSHDCYARTMNILAGRS